MKPDDIIPIATWEQDGTTRLKVISYKGGRLVLSETTPQVLERAAQYLQKLRVLKGRTALTDDEIAWVYTFARVLGHVVSADGLPLTIPAPDGSLDAIQGLYRDCRTMKRLQSGEHPTDKQLLLSVLMTSALEFIKLEK